MLFSKILPISVPLIILVLNCPYVTIAYDTNSLVSSYIDPIVGSTKTVQEEEYDTESAQTNDDSELLPPLPPLPMNKGRRLKDLVFRKKPIFENMLNKIQKKVLDTAKSAYQLEYTSLPVKTGTGVDETSSEEGLAVQAFELMSGIVGRSVRDVIICASQAAGFHSGENKGECTDITGRSLSKPLPLDIEMIVYNTEKGSSTRRRLPVDFSLDNIKIWDKDNPTKIICLFMPYELQKGNTQLSKITKKMIKAFVEKYGSSDPHNIVELRWPEIWKKKLSILQLAKRFIATADHLAKILARWHKKGQIILEQVHIIGFSLGAHLAGVISDKLKLKSSGGVDRVTGLDPLGWGFDEMDGVEIGPENELTSDDANFVDVIHTSTPDSDFPFIHYGTGLNRGNVDFFPNNGRARYCGPTNGLCHHLYSTVLYTASILGIDFNSCRCQSWDAFSIGKCNPCKKSAKMGENVTRTADGKYYLLTA